jgi:hypothetical protein
LGSLNVCTSGSEVQYIFVMCGILYAFPSKARFQHEEKEITFHLICCRHVKSVELDTTEEDDLLDAIQYVVYMVKVCSSMLCRIWLYAT